MIKIKWVDDKINWVDDQINWAVIRSIMWMITLTRGDDKINQGVIRSDG